jgi:hypothetical protein
LLDPPQLKNPICAPANLATPPETSSKISPIRREKTPNLATQLNVLTVQHQRKSMRHETENEAGMKLKLILKKV